MRSCLIAIYVLICIQFQLSAQIEFHYPFHNLSSQNGLPSSEVYMVKQDSKGLIWICSDGGVTKYDGHMLQTFTTSDGLTDNVVFDIYEDHKGRIWFLTYNSELCYFDGKRIVKYRYNEVIKKNRNTSSSNVKQLYIDKNDIVYYSIHQSGFIQINADGSHKRRSYEFNAIEFIYDDNRVVSSYSVSANIPNTSFPVNIYKEGKKRKVGEVNEYVKRLKVVDGSQGKFAILNNRLIDIESFQTIYSGNVINDAIQTDKSTIWISTAVGAVKLVNNKNGFTIENRILQDHFVSSVSFDSNGGIWISSLTGGVFYTPDLSVEYASIEDGLFSSDIRDLLYHDSSIYISYNKSWQFVDKSGKFSTHKSSILSPRFALLGNKVVVASNSNLDINAYRSDLKNIFIRPFRSMYVQGDMIFGALDRIYSVQYMNDRFVQDTLINKVSNKVRTNRIHFNTVCYTDEGLLIGGKDGLFQLKDGQLVPYFRGGGNFELSIKQIIRTRTWGLVVATYDKGLLIIKNGRIIRNWQSKDGLLSNQIKCVYESKEGVLLIGTNYGLNYIPQDQNWVGRISAENGMLGGNINAISESDHHILLGTINGLYRVRKKSLQKRDGFNNQKIFLEDLKFDNKPISNLSKKVNYRYGTGNVQISFRTVNYSNWMNKVYEYRLSPYDAWIRVYSPKISITRPKGDYKIEIRYRLGEGHWSKPVHLVSLYEDVPFWAQPVFWVIVSLLILAVVLIWTRRMFKIREHRLILANEVMSLQQRIEHVRLNPHFIFNVLNSIHGFVLFNERKKAEKYLLKFSSVMRSFLTKSKEGSLTIKEEMRILKGYLELESIRFEEGISIQFSGEIDSEVLIPAMIIQPVLENAVKYSSLGANKKKCIEVSVVIEKELVLVEVMNSGLMSVENRKRFESSNDIHAIGINHKRLDYYCKIFKNQNFGMKAINNDSKNRTEIWIQLPILKSYENINS